MKKQSLFRRRKKKVPQGGPGSLLAGGGASVNTLIYEPWMPIFPSKVTKWLRYSTTFAGATTSGAITSTQVFRANDLFDPDFTSTGHQPMGFDQLMVWYNHFCVVNAKIRIVCKNTATSSPTACLRVDADSTALTVIDRVVEFGGCVTESLEVKSQYGANKVLSMAVNIPKIQGVNRNAITADANLRGTAAASPTEITYFHITMWDTAGTTGSMECDVVLEQEAIFFEPRDITQSLVVSKLTPPSAKSEVPLGSLGNAKVCTSAMQPIVMTEEGKNPTVKGWAFLG